MFSCEQYLDIFNNPILIFKNKFASIYIIFLGKDGIFGFHIVKFFSFILAECDNS